MTPWLGEEGDQGGTQEGLVGNGDTLHDTVAHRFVSLCAAQTQTGTKETPSKSADSR